MTKSIGVKLNDDLQKRLKALAEKLDRSPDWLMEKAIAEFVDRVESAEHDRQILLERWSIYQETEESIPHETVLSWLETLGTEMERPFPLDLKQLSHRAVSKTVHGIAELVQKKKIKPSQ